MSALSTQWQGCTYFCKSLTLTSQTTVTGALGDWHSQGFTAMGTWLETAKAMLSFAKHDFPIHFYAFKDTFTQETMGL